MNDWPFCGKRVDPMSDDLQGCFWFIVSRVWVLSLHMSYSVHITIIDWILGRSERGFLAFLSIDSLSYLNTVTQVVLLMGQHVLSSTVCSILVHINIITSAFLFVVRIDLGFTRDRDDWFTG